MKKTKKNSSVWSRGARLTFLVALSAGLAGGAPGEERVLPVSEGTSLTVYEKTGGVSTFTFPVSSLTGSGAEFLTHARERYTLTSDGTYLTIHCYHHPAGLEEEAGYAGEMVEGVPFSLPYENLLGYQAGNNIVAARLDGVLDFPAGLWASFIVDCTIGDEGVADTKYNVLGDALKRGPYGRRLYSSFLGKGHSEIILGFSPELSATIDLAPDLASGRLRVYVELPDGYEAGDIVFSTVAISRAGDPEVDIAPDYWSMKIADYDNDGISDLGFDFDGAARKGLLVPGNISLTVTGILSGGIPFSGVGAAQMGSN